MIRRRNDRVRFLLLVGLSISLLVGRVHALGADDWEALFAPPELTSGPSSSASTSLAGPAEEGEPPEASAVPSWLTTGEDVMRFTADYVEYDRKAGRVVLRGGAYADHGDIRLWAEGMELEMTPGRLYAAGEVRFLRTGDDIRGATLDYNYKLREGEMTEIQTWRGPNRVVAKRLAIAPNKLTGHDIYTTACDHDPPHYKVSARSGTLFPGEKLVLERAALVWGRKKILSFPRYKANLQQRSSSQFYLRPGYSTSRGFTVDASYDFYFSDHEYGRVLLNSTSEAGGGGGVAFRYGADQPNGGDLRVGHNETRVKNQDPLFASSYLDQSTESLIWTHRQEIGRRTKLNVATTATSVDSGTAAANKELNLQATLLHDLPDLSLQLQVSRRVDLDGPDYAADDQVAVLNLSPVLTLAKKTPFDLGGGFKLRSGGTLGRYAERTSGGVQRDIDKSELSFDLSGPGLELGRTRLQWTLQEKLAWYSEDMSRNFMGLTVNGQTPLRRGWELAYNYVLQREHGESPFAAWDNLPDQQIGSLFLRQRNGRTFNATWFEVSRDLDLGQNRRAASSFSFHSPEAARTPWGFGLNLAYSFDGERELDDMHLQTVSNNLRVGRGRWRHQLVTNYDWKQRQLASFSTGSDFVLDDIWRLQVASNYGRGGSGDLERTRLALALTRDLHAWEAKLRWDLEQREVFLEFYLKHQTQKKLGIRADYDFGADLHPFMGEKKSHPGPQLRDIPTP